MTDQRSTAQTILVAERDPIIRLSLAEALSVCGYGVLEASDEEEAICAAAEHHASIHALVTELHARELNGFALARRLQQLQPDVQVVIFSTCDPGELPLDFAPDSFLRKPLHPRVVAATITRLLLRSPATGS